MRRLIASFMILWLVMVRVSSNELTDKTKKQLFNQLANLFTQADKKVMPLLFSNLLTETEEIMIMKRLAIIVMLSKKQSPYTISKALNVSSSTVRETAKKRGKGDYQDIERSLKKKDFDNKKFWETVDQILRMGMPRYGSGRWKSVYKMLDE